MALGAMAATSNSRDLSSRSVSNHRTNRRTGLRCPGRPPSVSAPWRQCVDAWGRGSLEPPLKMQCIPSVCSPAHGLQGCGLGAQDACLDSCWCRSGVSCVSSSIWFFANRKKTCALWPTANRNKTCRVGYIGQHAAQQCRVERGGLQRNPTTNSNLHRTAPLRSTPPPRAT